ncbi:DUF58 domain-containing protein [Trueperella abortisuis]|uniref:Uncharacterized protein (DUF58 family) n=1 Tax=Trueperella abortisuis TaxID=445930 RepID=A0ABT9PGK8_9ACTO|nr:DUF58 domain-containing protein [Trueperella abortisuis]MDP9831843.1 uncharacterized protein (DUF58 family) [Trueperella abortisuis]
MFIRLPAVVCSALGIVLAVVTRDAGVALLVSIILALVVLADAALAPNPALLVADHDGEDSVRVGDETHATITLSNPSGRRISGVLRDAWPPSANVSPTRHAFALPARSETSFDATRRPDRRGTIHSSALTIRTFGPLGLAGRQKSAPTSWQIHVLPPFVSRRHIPSRVRQLRELDGRALLLTRGEGTEFDSLREYVAGDDVRAIDWRSTARLGETLVRTWRPERDRHVVVVLDAGRGGALRVADVPAFDAFIEVALLQSAIAQRAGDRVSVIAVDNTLRARLAAERTKTITHKVAQTLADIEPTLNATDWASLPLYISQISKRPAFVVIATTMGGGTLSSGLVDVLPTLKRTHTVLIAAVHPDEPAPANGIDAIYERAAHERSELEANNLARSLESAGAKVVRGDAERLPVAVVDTYMNLKARGLL